MDAAAAPTHADNASDASSEPPAKRPRHDPPAAAQPLEQTGPRPRLSAVSTLPDAIHALRAAKRVLVLVGAGTHFQHFVHKLPFDLVRTLPIKR